MTAGVRGGALQSSFAGSSSGEGGAGEASSLSASLTSMVKRRRRRSWASEPGLKWIPATLRSEESLPEQIGLVWLLASFKSMLSFRA